MCAYDGGVGSARPHSARRSRAPRWLAVLAALVLLAWLGRRLETDRPARPVAKTAAAITVHTDDPRRTRVHSQASAPPRVVCGRVTYPEEDKGLAGARVSVYSERRPGPTALLEPEPGVETDPSPEGVALSDADGRFEVALPPDAEPTRVVVVAARLHVSSKEIPRSTERRIDVGTIGTWWGAGFSGRVLDPDGKALPGALVIAAKDRYLRAVAVKHETAESAAVHRRLAAYSTLESLRWPYELLAVTDTEGRFELLGCSADAPYHVVAVHARFAMSKPVETHVGGWITPADLGDLRVRRPGSILVRIETATGTAVVLDAVRVGTLLRTPRRVPVDASVRLLGIDPGPHLLTISPHGRLPIAREVEVKAGAESSLTLRLPEERPVRGRVQDTFGNGLADAQVRISVWPPEGVAREVYGENPDVSVTTGPDGRFALEGVPEGHAFVSASHDGYATVEHSGAATEFAECRLTLPRTGFVTADVQIEGATEPLDIEALKARTGEPGSDPRIRSSSAVRWDEGGGATRRVTWELPEGAQAISLEGETTFKWERVVRVATGTTIDVGPIRLRKAPHWRVEIRGPDERPILTILSLSVLSGERALYRCVSSCAFDEFRIRRPDSSQYPIVIVVSAGGFEEARVTVEPKPDAVWAQTVRVDLRAAAPDDSDPGAGEDARVR